MPKTNIARTEFAAALNQICTERGIKPQVVLETIKQAILAAFRKDALLSEEAVVDYQVELDPKTGEAHIQDAKAKDVTPPGFGRIAAQTAKQVILQRVREAEKEAVIEEYKDKIGTLANGTILRFEGKLAIVDIDRAQAEMPSEEQAVDEYYRLNQRLTVYIKEIRDTLRGQKVIVSRSDPNLIRELFAREVPEISSGAVKIVAVAREAGHRTKIAVDSTEDGVDPVGSCVGQKGVRVQAVINQLGGEKIDIIQYTKNPVEFLRAALSPAENLVIELNKEKKTAKVITPEDQQSIAIGKGGQNVRLASQLTGWQIDITGNGKSSTAGTQKVISDDQTKVKKRKTKSANLKSTTKNSKTSEKK